MPPEEVRVSAILQARLVAVSKNFRGKRFKLRARLPSIQRQSRFLAGLFEESDAIPSVLDRNLGQQQAAMTRHADKEAMPGNCDLLGANGLEMGKDTEGNFVCRMFVGTARQ